MSHEPIAVALMLTTPGWRGSGTSFRKIAAGLARRGHDVMMVAGDPVVAELLALPGVTVHHVPTGDTGRREVGAVRRLLRAQRTAVVLADAPRDVRIARYASWPSRRAIVWRYNLHGRQLATDPLQHWLFRGLRHMAHLSRYGADRLATTTPWLSRIPTSVIPNGFDVAALSPAPDRGLAWRQAHGIAADARVVLTPTPALPEKSVDVAAAAVTRVAATRRDIHWVVGESPGGLATIEVAAAPWQHAVGRLPVAELHDAMRAADLVLLPAASELFGNVTAEAMALECAVVAASGGATPEVVGDAGLLFPVGDAAAAASAVGALLEDPARRAALGVAARQRIATCYPLAAMEEGFDALVRDLAD